ncbi:MAG: hypothetical protein JWM33_1491 [Caulobacteraceae bacterium]|nr:hypothetical protein [Caulobacteraceae bacterium]
MWSPRRTAEPENEVEIMTRTRLSLSRSERPVKRRHRRTPARAAAGAVVLVAVLTGGALTAFAAAPSAPERLPSEVQGVVGSGDKLSLRLKDSAGGRTIAVGEAYGDGWTLTGLTPTQATLAKDGATREVGLNPTGALASAAPAAPPSLVEVTLNAEEQAALAALTGGAPVRPRDGLTLSQTERYMLQSQKVIRRQALIQQGVAAGGPLWSDDLSRPSHAVVVAALGEADAAEYEAMVDRLIANAPETAAQRASLAAQPLTGPSSVTVPRGVAQQAAMDAAGADPRGFWLPGPPDAEGQRTFSRVSDVRTNLQQLNLVSTQNDAIRAAAAASGAPAPPPGPQPAPRSP